jgi:hypothetical protein
VAYPTGASHLGPTAQALHGWRIGPGVGAAVASRSPRQSAATVSDHAARRSHPGFHAARIQPRPLAANRGDTTVHAIESRADVMVRLKHCASLREAHCDAKPQVSMGM